MNSVESHRYRIERRQSVFACQPELAKAILGNGIQIDYRRGFWCAFIQVLFQRVGSRVVSQKATAQCSEPKALRGILKRGPEGIWLHRATDVAAFNVILLKSLRAWVQAIQAFPRAYPESSR